MSVITKNNIAVMSVQYCQYSFDYFLTSMQECGIGNIDFWGGEPHYCRLQYHNSNDALSKLRTLRAKIDDRGMKVVVYTPETLSYPFSLSSPERVVRQKTIDYFSYAMEDALRLGTHNVFINSGCGLRDIEREQSWSRMAETISTICSQAETCGVTMILEQLQPYESNLITRLEDVDRILHEVGSTALKVCVDVVAMAVAGERLEHYFKTFPEAIALIHLADGDPSGHYVLGDGKLPLHEYVSCLERAGYANYVSLEINDSIYWLDPHRSIKRSMNYLRGILPERDF